MVLNKRSLAFARDKNLIFRVHELPQFVMIIHIQVGKIYNNYCIFMIFVASEASDISFKTITVASEASDLLFKTIIFHVTPSGPQVFRQGFSDGEGCGGGSGG